MSVCIKFLRLKQKGTEKEVNACTVHLSSAMAADDSLFNVLSFTILPSFQRALRGPSGHLAETRGSSYGSARPMVIKDGTTT